MVVMGISNNLSKFESQILSYKKVSEFEIFSYVNKARVLLLLHMFIHEYWYEFKSNVAFLVDYIFYEHNKSVYLVCQIHFSKEVVISVLFVICKNKIKCKTQYLSTQQ